MAPRITVLVWLLAWRGCVGAVPTKFAGGSGEEAMALLADPVLLLRHKAEWMCGCRTAATRASSCSKHDDATLKEGIYAGRDGNSAHQWTSRRRPRAS